MSNIIKQFKLSCSKIAAQFQSMQLSNGNFSAYIDVFTPNTYVMVVISDPNISEYGFLWYSKVNWILYSLLGVLSCHKKSNLSYIDCLVFNYI